MYMGKKASTIKSCIQFRNAKTDFACNPESTKSQTFCITHCTYCKLFDCTPQLISKLLAVSLHFPTLRTMYMQCTQCTPSRPASSHNPLPQFGHKYNLETN